MMKSENDKYYTNNKMIERCVDELKKVIDFSTVSCIVEPSAGDGRWYKFLRDLCQDVRMFDLVPDSPDVVRADFLRTDLDLPMGTIFVGNPPFGKANSMATHFFRRASEYCPDYICFIIPRSFGRRLSHRKKLPLEYSPVSIVSLDDFGHFYRPDGKVYNGDSRLRVDFQIWKRERRNPVDIKPPREYSVLRGKSVKIKEDGRWCEMPIGYDNRVDADFSIHTHGTKAGKICDFDPCNQKPNVFQFVKVHDGYDADMIREKFKNADFSYFLDAALMDAQRSLSTDEIVACVEGIDCRLI